MPRHQQLVKCTVHSDVPDSKSLEYRLCLSLEPVANLELHRMIETIAYAGIWNPTAKFTINIEPVEQAEVEDDAIQIP